MAKTNCFWLTAILALLAHISGRAYQLAPASSAQEAGPVTVTHTVTFRVAIATDAVSLFQYLSDARKLEMWFPDRAIMEPQLGGRYHFRWQDAEGVWSGVVTEYKFGSALGFTWRPPGDREETQVRVKLLPQGAQTLIELTHGGFVSDVAVSKAVNRWGFYLRNLKSVVEQGKDMRSSRLQPPPARQRAGKKDR